MDAILPAAGMASRMRGIPKFLLPCDEIYTTLIERHLEAIFDIVDTIWIPTRPDLVLLLETLGIGKEKVVLLPVTTENMTQTVARVLQISAAEHFMLIMPDTYFLGGQPYELLDPEPEFVELACWKIRDEQKGKLGQINIGQFNQVTDMVDKDLACEFEYIWGALTFSKKISGYLHMTDPHVGYGIKNGMQRKEIVTAKKIEGEYFDCGTPSEYLKLLPKALSS